MAWLDLGNDMTLWVLPPPPFCEGLENRALVHVCGSVRSQEEGLKQCVCDSLLFDCVKVCM